MQQRTVLAMAAALSLASAAVRTAPAQAVSCVGDCDGDAQVTVSELVTGVNVTLGALPMDRCPDLDASGNGSVTIEELVAAVNSALAGCTAGNRAPQASDVSFAADPATPYVSKQLIGSDPDHDTLTYELVAGDAGTGYTFAHLNPTSGVLYVTLAAEFRGSIVLPYRVTDGQLFSETASATIVVDDAEAMEKGGAEPVSAREYASFPRGFYYGDVLGAPGNNPTLPSSVDLSADFPLPGNQGRQSSCVAWALGYAIKSYQERMEHGWSLAPTEHLFSPAYIYNQLNGGQDLGLVYSQALDFVVDGGVSTLARMPYDDFDFLTQPSVAAHQEAPRYRNQTWRAANGVLDAKAALANHLPVFMVIQLMSDIHGLRGPDSVYNTFGGVFEIGHAVAAVGYDDNRYGGAFKIMNSWGRNWGDGGYFWMPYWTTTATVQTPDGPTAVLTGAVVVEDAPDPGPGEPDPVETPLPGDAPDLQVTNWSASYNGAPGGAGSLQYTITNTGTATAPAGSFVALVLSTDAQFRSGNTLVVYEQIPFAMAPGTTAYRDAGNAIAFRFPDGIAPGTYAMAVWADIWNDVAETSDGNNISPSTTPIAIVNTLPDMQVQSWYATWDAFGSGSLVYDLLNGGASTAPTGWLVTLALSPDPIIGDGDEIFLFSEPAAFEVPAGGTLYRNESAAAGFNLFIDYFGNAVPDGDYSIALWVDPNGTLAESNDYNNASVSWGTIGISRTGVRAAALAAATEDGVAISGEAYNGKSLPARDGDVRRVRLTTVDGERRVQAVGDAPAAPLPKTAVAKQQVVFPVAEMIPMP